MNAEEKTINGILSNKKYIIPSYQRPYSWDAENVIQLIDDIYTSFQEGIQEYFIGSLICIEKESEIYEVVDGQQRLITIGLIIASLRNIISNEDIKIDLQQKIILKDPYRSNAQEEPRLKIRNNEYDIYTNYILQGKNSFLPSNPTYIENLFIDNFEKIQDYLKALNSEAELCKLAEYTLKNVFVVSVTTNSFTSSYRLFNVLNTRGLPLTPADLLKNRLFEIADKERIPHNRVETHWLEIENILGIENMKKFLWITRLSLKTTLNRVTLNIVEGYINDLKNKFSEKELINFICELKRYASNYQKVMESDFDDVRIYRILKVLNILSDEWMPPVLAFINKENNGKIIDYSNLAEFLILFEKSYVQGWFLGKPKNHREQVCYDVLVAINTNKSFDEIKQCMIKNINNNSIDIYFNQDIFIPSSSQRTFLKYVLLRIDQELDDESASREYGKTISIEHILPQTMNDEYWTSRFTPENHKKWVHKLGNLTLLCGNKNSKASNSSFDKKIDIYNKNNRRSPFNITKDLSDYSEWNLDTLSFRHETLLEFAKEIWAIKMPTK
jgi:uncharacterized protein with ParB-like and HNH nuclease domain